MPDQSDHSLTREDRPAAVETAPGTGAPPPRRWRRLALGGAGLAAVAVLGIWFARVWIVDLALRSALAERGIAGDFKIGALDLGRAELSGVRLGPSADADFSARRIEVRYVWSWLSPSLTSARIESPRLHLRLDPKTGLNAGQLQRLTQGGGSGGRRPTLPRMALDIVDGQAVLDAPFGRLNATLQASGTLGRDFTAQLHVPETTSGAGPYALTRGGGDLMIASRNDTVDARLTASAGALHWDDTNSTGASLEATASTSMDLSLINAHAGARLASLRSSAANVEALSATAQLGGGYQGDKLHWRMLASLLTTELSVNGNELHAPHLNLDLSGVDGAGQGRATLSAARFIGFDLNSATPRADAAINFDKPSQGRAQVDLHLAQTALTPQGHARLRSWIPGAGGSPVGPTLTAARNALERAGDQFDLTLPASITWRDAVHVSVDAPIIAHAATGARVQVAPRSAHAPALALQLGGAMQGSAELSMAGGGLPDASILFDSINWSPNTAFNTNAHLVIRDWRAQNARIAADDLKLRISAPPQGDGRVDVTGLARITGPVGDGMVRDLAADLDLGVTFGANGWRVAPNQGCVPLRLSGLEVAGLSFQGGAFELCPSTGGALIAADTRNALSGGFTIADLHLDGHMAGPNGQPARISSTQVRGQFGGTTDDMRVAIEAAAPNLAIVMDRTRTMAITGQRVTANARVWNGTWRVDGAFDAGMLNDPSLPGTVSAIAGRWSAAPEQDAAVVRVAAGEALVTAHAPANGKEQPLFHTLRVSNVGAVVRNGLIDATGDILLQDHDRSLAHFTAHHVTATGAGSAHIAADDLVFDKDFQPSQISELARGVTENVEGHASGAADINWTNDGISSSGVIRPLGLSLATATIPVIQNVTGEVHFDDLFKLTTPPGQTVHVGLINPGVEVRDGVIQFQLLPESRVAIERADFQFADGVLAVTPTQLQLGSDETRLELTLRDVDVAKLVTQLNMADLHATGRVEGRFPLRLTSRTAFIENGTLSAQAPGGEIAYVGAAGDAAQGPAKLAFDALKHFRYDSLSLTLNGDLSGDVVTAIQFNGENVGQGVSLGAIGPAQIAVNHLPFRFHVQVTAPFRSLAETASSISNPRSLIDRAQHNQTTPPVDQTPPAPR